MTTRPSNPQRQSTAATAKDMRPSNPQRQSTAATAKAVRPSHVQRQSTARTARTARTTGTERDADYNMAGPPQQQTQTSDPHGTYYEEGYQRLNPQMSKGKPGPNFSLASTFPHKVRWGRKQPKDDDPQAVEDADKVGTEPAPMVDEANEQSTRQNDGKEADTCDLDTIESEDFEDDSPDTRVQRRTVDAYNSDGEKMGNVAEEAAVDPDKDDLPFNHWALFRQKFQFPLAEWLGATILVFIGVCGNLSVVTSNQTTGSLSSLQAPCWGFAVMLSIYTSGGSSGAFLNPALTVMLSIFRGFPARRVPIYILAQIFGAFTGALLAFSVYRDNIIHLDGALLPETTGIAFYTQPKDWVSNATAFFTEFLGAAVIGCSILALGDSGNSPPGAGMHAFIIGLLTTTVTMALGYSTGGAFNPVRDFGPRLATMAVGYPTSIFTTRQNWWIWGPWFATITGTLFGALVYDLCIFKGGESPVNYSHNRWKMESLKESRDFTRALGMDHTADDLERKLEDGDLYDT